MVNRLHLHWRSSLCNYLAAIIHVPLKRLIPGRFQHERAPRVHTPDVRLPHAYVPPIRASHAGLPHARLLLTLLTLTLLSLTLLPLTHPQPVSAASTAYSITLTADTNPIYLGDSIVIEMETVGIEGDVDLTPLLKRAELLRETQGTRIAVKEQNVVEVKLRRMEFLPQQEGLLIMGPLQGEGRGGGVSSNTLEFNVLPAITEQWQPDSADLQVSFTLTDGISGNRVPADAPYTTYIGQRIIADIELRHRYPIADEEFVLPDFDGFDVLAGHEQRRTVERDATTETDSVAASKVKEIADSTDVAGNTGKAESEKTGNPESSADSELAAKSPSSSADNWRVIAWRYHLFAQRSGQLTIGEVSWRGIAIRSRTQRAEFEKRIPPRTLQIKPANEGMNWWLPASALSLEDDWSSDALDLSAGDEVNRTITLEARNVLASHLPEVQPLQSRALSSALIDQSRSQRLVGDQIQASATFTFRMLAESPIPVFLDTVRVGWYDTTQSELREAIIPARRINVGLPERADLLAALALNDSWIDRLALEIRSVANGFAYWHVSLVVLGLIASLLMVWEILRALRERSDQKDTGIFPPL